jgi:hypothetical protein
MTGYPGYFIDHSGQITALLSVAIVWLGLTSLGAFVGGPKRLWEATPFYGWALVSIVFTIGGVFTTIPFTAMTIALAALAIPAGILAFHRDGALFPAGTGRIIILTLPLLILVSAMVGSQWDEFSDWLFTPRQLLQNDHFPDRTNKHLSGALAAYPFNWHFITFLASRVSGHLAESAGALVNVLLLSSFGLYLGRLIKEAEGSAAISAPGWALCALGALLAIPFNPTFAQKVALTSYADTSTAIAVAFAAILAWQMLNALSEDRKDDARSLAFQMALVLVVLTNMKQATLVLFLIVVGATVLTGLRDPKIRITELLRHLPMIILPSLIIYFAWRYHVTNELGGRELSIRSFSEWYIAEIPQILARMLLVFTKKGLYLVLFVGVAYFSIRGLLRMRTPFDRLAVIVGAIMLGYNFFLLFSYVAVFGKFDAIRVASFWRYNMHLGPIAIVLAVYGLAGWYYKRRPKFMEGPIPGRIAIVLIIAAPFFFAEKLRFDKAKHVPFYRSVGIELGSFLKDADTLIVVDPIGSGESAAITRFQLGKKMNHYKSYLSAFHTPTAENIAKRLSTGGYSHALIHSVTPDLNKGVGLDLETDSSYLLLRDGDIWRVIKRWQAPEGFQAR